MVTSLSLHAPEHADWPMVDTILAFAGLRFEREYAPVKKPKHKYVSWPEEAVIESQLQPQDKEHSAQLRQQRGPIRQTNELVPVPQKPHLLHTEESPSACQ